MIPRSTLICACGGRVRTGESISAGLKIPERFSTLHPRSRPGSLESSWMLLAVRYGVVRRHLRIERVAGM